MPKTIAEEFAEKTFRELTQTSKPEQRSRIWKSPNGYIFLVPWANECLLRVFVRKFTDTLPKKELRLKIQLDDAARSHVANIEEGYARATTIEYLDFQGFSYGSLKEI